MYMFMAATYRVDVVVEREPIIPRLLLVAAQVGWAKSMAPVEGGQPLGEHVHRIVDQCRLCLQTKRPPPDTLHHSQIEKQNRQFLWPNGILDSWLVVTFELFQFNILVLYHLLTFFINQTFQH